MRGTSANQPRNCWCGSESTEPFSAEYRRCPRCATLVSQYGLANESLQVKNDEQDFYGKEYWLSHQTSELGKSDIFSRVRGDLHERCLYWLQTTLKYKLPGSKVLELGSAHGGFVALLHEAGYDVQGLELSPWVVEFSRNAFDVKVLLGTIENQQLPLESLDAIVLNDVLEHLPDPVATIRSCKKYLKADGILMVQTPCYPEGESYEEMQARGNRFLEMMDGLAPQHLYLFSKKAARLLFTRLGFETVKFEAPLFPYDMYCVVGGGALPEFDAQRIQSSLGRTRGQRVMQALLDQRAVVDSLRVRLAESEQDRAKRLENMNILDAWLRESQAKLEALRIRTATVAWIHSALPKDSPDRKEDEEEDEKDFETFAQLCDEEEGVLVPRLFLMQFAVTLFRWEMTLHKAYKWAAKKLGIDIGKKKDDESDASKSGAGESPRGPHRKGLFASRSRNKDRNQSSV